MNSDSRLYRSTIQEIAKIEGDLIGFVKKNGNIVITLRQKQMPNFDLPIGQNVLLTLTKRSFVIEEKLK